MLRDLGSETGLSSEPSQLPRVAFIAAGAQLGNSQGSRKRRGWDKRALAGLCGPWPCSAAAHCAKGEGTGPGAHGWAIPAVTPASPATKEPGLGCQELGSLLGNPTCCHQDTPSSAARAPGSDSRRELPRMLEGSSATCSQPRSLSLAETALLLVSQVTCTAAGVRSLGYPSESGLAELRQTRILQGESPGRKLLQTFL